MEGGEWNGNRLKRLLLSDVQNIVHAAVNEGLIQELNNFVAELGSLAHLSYRVRAQPGPVLQALPVANARYAVQVQQPMGDVNTPARRGPD